MVPDAEVFPNILLPPVFPNIGVALGGFPAGVLEGVLPKRLLLGAAGLLLPNNPPDVAGVDDAAVPLEAAPPKLNAEPPDAAGVEEAPNRLPAGFAGVPDDAPPNKEGAVVVVGVLAGDPNVNPAGFLSLSLFAPNKPPPEGLVLPNMMAVEVVVRAGYENRGGRQAGILASW